MRGTLLTVALVFALPALASASGFGVGLDWRQNVFVQEFWQAGKARYAIYNSRPEAIKLTVNDVQSVSVPGTESFRAVEGKELATWEVKGKAIVFVDAPMAPVNDGLRFLQFRIADGPRLGMLTYPAAPADFPRNKILSCVGVNGSGGRQQDVWYEHDSLTLESDGIIEVKLKLPAGGETVTFKKEKGIEKPAEALISEAVCATLPIQDGKEEITIDTSKPLKAADVHVVTLRFKAPRVDAPTMVVIDGWVSVPSTVPGTSGGGYHAVRGVIVLPPEPEPARVKEHREKMQGVWTAVELDGAGQNVPKDAKEFRMLFKEDTVTFDRGGEKKEFSVRLQRPPTTGQSAQQGEIDLIPVGDKPEPTWRGIYFLSDATFKLCFHRRDPQKRPSEFSAKTDVGFWRIDCRRPKP
jgi:uncharacterized protein (TIGR03067 family)